jgi:carboxymethylenebutenolidase
MEMTIPGSGGTIGGYLAEPEGAGPHPGVVLIHDAFGLSQDSRNITDRFATEGYLALSPDLYSRGGMRRCVRRVFSDMFANRGQAFDDIEASRALLAARADSNGRIGIAGFCMGGGFALVAASRGFEASAPYYGQLPKNLSVLDDACPIVASFGKKDFSLRGAAGKLETALTERDVPHDVKEYPGASHGFANKIDVAAPLNLLLKVVGFTYHAEAAEDSWRRVTAFFGEHLQQPTRPSL